MTTQTIPHTNCPTCGQMRTLGSCQIEPCPACHDTSLIPKPTAWEVACLEGTECLDCRQRINPTDQHECLDGQQSYGRWAAHLEAAAEAAANA